MDLVCNEGLGSGVRFEWRRAGKETVSCYGRIDCLWTLYSARRFRYRSKTLGPNAMSIMARPVQRPRLVKKYAEHPLRRGPVRGQGTEQRKLRRAPPTALADARGMGI